MFSIIQLIVAILLIILILLQQRGSGLGAAFGGQGGVYRTKRGAEKFIFNSTIILAILFVGLALLNVYLATQKTGELPALDQTESAGLPAGDASENQTEKESAMPDSGQETGAPFLPEDESENPFGL